MSAIDVVQLAQQGAAAIVTAMMTDAWIQVRTRLAGMLSSGIPEREREEVDDLEGLRRSLLTADESAQAAIARDVETELRGQLKIHLRRDEHIAAQFAAFVAEVSEAVGGRSSARVSLWGNADRGSTVIQAGRDIIGGPRPGTS
jgi:hypothetical protein